VLLISVPTLWRIALCALYAMMAEYLNKQDFLAAWLVIPITLIAGSVVDWLLLGIKGRQLNEGGWAAAIGLIDFLAAAVVPYFVVAVFAFAVPKSWLDSIAGFNGILFFLVIYMGTALIIMYFSRVGLLKIRDRKRGARPAQ